MSVINTPHLRDQIRADRRRLRHACQRRGISLRAYKIIKAVTQLAGVAAGIYALSLGADPLTTFALISAIYLGPEAFEQILLNGEE